MEDEEVSGSHNILPQLKRPVINKTGDVWTLMTANEILVSAHQIDKDYMIRIQEEWDKENTDV